MIPDYSPSSNLLESEMLANSSTASVAAVLAASELTESHAVAKLGSAFLTN
jgi:hypothetical protein